MRNYSRETTLYYECTFCENQELIWFKFHSFNNHLNSEGNGIVGGKLVRPVKLFRVCFRPATRERLPTPVLGNLLNSLSPIKTPWKEQHNVLLLQALTETEQDISTKFTYAVCTYWTTFLFYSVESVCHRTVYITCIRIVLASSNIDQLLLGSNLREFR